MNKYTKLEEKIKSMTPKEVILSMIDGLENPVMEVLLTNWGTRENGICYGCAAANAICKLGGLDPKEEFVITQDMYYDTNHSRLYIENSEIVEDFENAINDLRLGNIRYCNQWLNEIGIPEIKSINNQLLPQITDDNYTDQEVLNAYRELAEYQK